MSCPGHFGTETIDNEENWFFLTGYEIHFFSKSMNEHSSRGHTILTIYIEIEAKTVGENGDTIYITRHGKINFVDLAGSEMVKKTNSVGKALTEASNINKSLMVLGNCISQLRWSPFTLDFWIVKWIRWLNSLENEDFCHSVTKEVINFLSKKCHFVKKIVMSSEVKPLLNHGLNRP